MSDERAANYRKERIERLLKELEYEIARGIIENEIEEEIFFRFLVPVSRKIPDGGVQCEFAARPVARHNLYIDGQPMKLRVVGGREA